MPILFQLLIADPTLQLQGVREKLSNDGDRLHREIVQHVAFSQSIVELTKIVSDGIASVHKISDSA